ncbi:TorD/DmsD family molecular chaperone [Arabiibacter massiliensis]|uniref:TorD/DmsD family molecular chaperone n=1 Tax=Arabiibacter massiliensis TaxID=1870985 RepID=UPI0009BAC6AC|nr:molecular chaperone TorD family protein [Arabiibacter massiliensis]
MHVYDDLEFLSARRFAYRMFQRLLGDEPAPELLAAIDVEVARAAFEVMGGPLAEGKGEELCALIADADGDAEVLASEYVRLFVGPAALPAAPWESVYRDSQRTIMTKTTLDVRNAYRAQGFIPRLYPRVPDDHIALELDFLASLADEAVDACEREDAAGCRAALEASGRFAEEHLGTWAGAFACDMREKGDSAFYAAVADALASFVAADAERLGAAADGI